MIRGLLLFFALANPALAARTTQPPSVQQLAAESTGVVKGTVISAVTERARGDVKTTYTVRRDDVLAGSSGEMLTVVLPGGVLGDVIITPFGVPVWSEGDRVLVFVHGDKPVRLTAVFTLRDESVVDPWQRPIALMPDRLDVLVERVREVQMAAPAGADRPIP